MKIYALKVKATKEHAAIKELELKNITAVCPSNKKLSVRKNLTVSEDLDPLLKGYIFILVEELTDEMRFLIGKMYNVQYILDKEIEAHEYECIIDQEEIFIETRTKETRRELKSIYGMIRSTFKTFEKKLTRKIESLDELKIRVENKLVAGRLIKRSCLYITEHDYNKIFA